MVAIVIGGTSGTDSTIAKVLEENHCVISGVDIEEYSDIIEDYLSTQNRVTELSNILSNMSREIERFAKAVDVFKDISNYENDYSSYVPRFGTPNAFLTVDPQVIHNLVKPRDGHRIPSFYRKCFMQLKTFSNLRRS